MFSIFQRILDWIKSLFWKEEMEITLVGLQYSGKTTFVNVIATGQYCEDMIPTVGFNMKKITKGKVSIKVICGSDIVVESMPFFSFRFMVDASDRDKLDAARNELHTLMDKTQLAGIPVLVLGNKRDLPGALTEVELIEALSLRTIPNREICCYSISCKEQDNIGLSISLYGL
ncbi:unnamed protein product [Hymenolepis diminuta]|uniref:ADP-ribosylation factor-like protein 8A n=1 Tax=Hymenolepis diminuta TaxID=6216 RepID=A0A0R3S7Y1_HYMDI|nr:unnamed protein product [Hymenolepis diminuta]